MDHQMHKRAKNSHVQKGNPTEVVGRSQHYRHAEKYSWKQG